MISLAMTSSDRGFTGKERDNETGLDFFGARYMSAAQGRFTSPDPLLNSAKPWEPQSWNRYTYGLNNPLRYTDPTGLYVWDVSLGGADSDDDLLRKAGKIKAARAAARSIIDERKYIRNALNKLGKSKDTVLSGAAAAIGNEGKDNGVTISMAALAPGISA